MRCRSDSKLTVNQVKREYQVKDPLLLKYFHRVSALMTDFEEVEVSHIRREENTQADVLSKLSSDKSKKGLSTLIQQGLPGPAVSTDRDAGKEIADPALRQKASRFLLVGENLYKRGFSTPLLKCLSKTEADYVMNELHNRVCGNHSGGRNMASRILRAGYYWPELRVDYAKFSKKCKSF